VIESFLLTAIVGVESDLHLLAIFSDRVMFEICYQNLHYTVKNSLNNGAAIVERLYNNSVGPHEKHELD
jgi:hypothetical protein